MRVIGVGFIAVLLVTAPLSAQVRADPGVVIGSRVAVRVNVTLADEDTPYSPVRGLALTFARVGSDTVVSRTDEAGVTTVLLTPGDYIVSAVRPYQWKGGSYSWQKSVTVRPDMGPVELTRANAITQHGVRGASTAVNRPAQNAGGAGTTADGASTRTSESGTIRWLSFEVGGEGGLTRLGSGSESDAGLGGAAAFVGGLGPFALALGYRYTSIRYSGDVDPGSMRGGTLELRYHFRPGAAAVRPYIGGVASAGSWYDSESLSSDHADMRMLGGTLGVQFGLATSVRLHVAATVAGTHVRTPPESSSNGVFATANVGLTFDIFSPAR